MWAPAWSQMARQHALPLVVARAVLVGLAEIAERDRSVDRRDDLRQPDLGRRSIQDVATADTALGPHEAGALERQQDLLEVRLGQAGALGDVADRRRPLLVAQCQRQERSTRVVASGGDAHGCTVGHESPESVDCGR